MRPVISVLLGSLASMVDGCTPSATPILANTAPIKPDVGVIRVDAPAWPRGAKDVQLTWDVSSDTDHPSPELVVQVGSVRRIIALGEQQGRIYPGNLSACERRMGSSGPNLDYLARTGELAKMTMVDYDEDMKPKTSTSFTVMRDPDGILEVWKVRGKTGECLPGDCTDRTMFAVITIPAGRISEELEDRTTATSRFNCGGDDGMNQ